MRLGLTMMVRDEVDIIGLIIDYYLAQGIDRIIVTDNASVDGTREILEAYASRGEIELHIDPRHHKQQASVVTSMARSLATGEAVDWVINADADEFLIPVDRSLSLREAFEQIPPSVEAFEVKVINMLGPLILEGWDTSGSIWRDHRSADELESAGLHSHPTPNAIHVARDDVDVVQGNHAVSIKGSQLPAGLQLEVLHFPWRSWKQYRQRVEDAGLAYEKNLAVTPSPNHHGMRDYGRLQSGTLLAYFAARLPPRTMLETMPSFVQDDFVARWAGERASPSFSPLDQSIQEGLHSAGAVLIDLEHQLGGLRAELEAQVLLTNKRTDELSELATRLGDTRAELHAARTRRAAIIADAVGRAVSRIKLSR